MTDGQIIIGIIIILLIVFIYNYTSTPVVEKKIIIIAKPGMSKGLGTQTPTQAQDEGTPLTKEGLQLTELATKVSPMMDPPEPRSNVPFDEDKNITSKQPSAVNELATNPKQIGVATWKWF